jgi:hypothetical protein
MAITKTEIIEACDDAIDAYTLIVNDKVTNGDIDNTIDKTALLSNITNIVRVTRVKQWAEDNL